MEALQENSVAQYCGRPIITFPATMDYSEKQSLNKLITFLRAQKAPLKAKDNRKSKAQSNLNVNCIINPLHVSTQNKTVHDLIQWWLTTGKVVNMDLTCTF